MDINGIKDLMTYGEVAKILTISKRTVIRLVDDGELKTIYISTSSPRIERGELERFMESRREATATK